VTPINLLPQTRSTLVENASHLAAPANEVHALENSKATGEEFGRTGACVNLDGFFRKVGHDPLTPNNFETTIFRRLAVHKL